MIAGVPRDFGVVWLSDGMVTAEEAWETQKFRLLFFSLFKNSISKLMPVGLYVLFFKRQFTLCAA